MNDENELIDAFLEPRSSENVPAQYAHDLAHIANRLRAERDACRVYSAEFTKRIKELTVENENLRLAVEGLKEESRELRETLDRVQEALDAFANGEVVHLEKVFHLENDKTKEQK